MSEAAEFVDICFQTTDGGIAAINLESARHRSWSRYHEIRYGTARLRLL